MTSPGLYGASYIHQAFQCCTMKSWEWRGDEAVVLPRTCGFSRVKGRFHCIPNRAHSCYTMFVPLFCIGQPSAQLLPKYHILHLTAISLECTSHECLFLHFSWKARVHHLSLGRHLNPLAQLMQLQSKW